MDSSAEKKSPKPVRILLASQNAHKREELESLLKNLETAQGVVIELLKTPFEVEVDENADSFIGNAKLKAFGYRDTLNQQGHMPPDVDFILAEDSGLSVEVLDGYQDLSPFPGVRSKRWLSPALWELLYNEPAPFENEAKQEQINQALLKLMESQSNRKAAYHCAMALIPVAGNQAIAETLGVMALSVGHAPKGDNGFGYDPIMHAVSNEQTDARSVAELSREEKNSLSHRASAFHQLMSQLAQQIKSPAS